MGYGGGMKQVEYTQFLTDKDKLRISFVQDRGKVRKFIVQYYGLTRLRWRTIMRIDNCHGYPHQHVYHLRAKEFLLPLEKDNNSAFTEAQGYIVKEFRKIRENFIFAK